ncbi:hypothetical protein QBC34DRAFT_155979 [Podospora aff. communis PSN243]|uniref:C2H2-type domain-containing protein n=1 Tax=Podospora aff. communis PSN243 TaxID=3040156 RepID=A0AAV9H0W8_9PEZI|nr:hypothetical protein QBC34DRAFT_155979 [Podospora aff. communis PSN243]
MWSTASLAVEMEPRSDARTPPPIESLLAECTLDHALYSEDVGKPPLYAIFKARLAQVERHHKLGSNADNFSGDRLECVETAQRYNSPGGPWKKRETTDAQRRRHHKSSLCRCSRCRITRLPIVRTKELVRGRGIEHVPGQHLEFRRNSRESGCCDPVRSSNKLSIPMLLLEGTPWHALASMRTRASKGASELQIELEADGTASRQSSICHQYVVGTHYQWTAAPVGDYTGGHEKPKSGEDQASNPVNSPRSNQSTAENPGSGDGKREERDECHENGDGDDQKPKKRRRRHSDGEEDISKRYACPFYKQNPSKYQNRTCIGPGFSSVSRVKEHIYRKHGPPPFECPRCFRTFSERLSIQEHLRAAEPCIARTREEQPPGISKLQMETLKKREKKTASGPERWRAIYRILFPTEEEIPSPYYDLNEDKVTSPYSIDTEEFRELLAEELPKRIGEEAARQLSIEALHMDTLTNIVRQAINDAFDGYITKQNSPGRDLLHQASITLSSQTAQYPLLREQSQGPEPSSFHDATSLGSIWKDEDHSWTLSENPTPSDCGAHSESSPGYGPPLTPLIPPEGYDYLIVPARMPVAYFPDFTDSSLAPVDTVSRSIGVSSKPWDASTPGLPAEPSQAGQNEDPVLQDLPSSHDEVGAP